MLTHFAIFGLGTPELLLILAIILLFELTKYHNRNIVVASVAADVFINYVEEGYNNTAQGIASLTNPRTK